MKPSVDRRPKVADRKLSTKLANGILKKQSLLNNNNIVKNLNDVKKPTATVGVTKAATPKRTKPPEPDLPQGCTPLMYACQQADEKLVAEILKKEPSSVLKRDRTLKTALHYCFDNPTAATADRIVMAAPSMLEARDQDGFTPLHLAVIQGNMPMVTFLLANNADVMALDNEKHSVVHWATVCGELEALRAVLSAGADPSTADIHGGYPLHYAAQMCGGANAAGGARLSLEVLGTLLRGATKVNVLDGQGRQPLLWAASAGSAPAILALVKAGAAVEAADKDGLTALHCAASRGHTECIETLLTLCGARPDVIDSNGCTALHYAVTLGHADATTLLLDHGSDPNRQDRKGRSPAHCGCAKGQLETVRMLAARGANVWLRNAKGDLPLHEAVASGRRDLVKWLLEIRPSQVNATNNDGRTLLHIAANTDNTDLCKIILDFGGEINAVLRTSKNILMTPLDCALHKGYRSTAKYLQMHGGLPASRLASRHVLVNQETIPQLPVRHIKSTKINLRDNVAIEKREIFEMSPGGTPRHKHSSKEGAVVSSSELSTEDYETENKRQREERRRQKKTAHRHRKDKMKSQQSSLSDGYEMDRRHKRSSLRHERSLSDSEGSGPSVKRKSKRSKSEPSEKVREPSRSRKSSRGDGKSAKSSESDSDSKYDKRRKTTPRKKTNLASSQSHDKERKEVLEKEIRTEIDARDDRAMNDSSSKVNEIIENIESNLSKLDHVIESELADGDANKLAYVQTTLITEAQVHVENAAAFEEDFEKFKVLAGDNIDTLKVDMVQKGNAENAISIEYTVKEDNENTETFVKVEHDKLVEHHAEIREEKINDEFVDNNVDVKTKDGIIAIIPDLDNHEGALSEGATYTKNEGEGEKSNVENDKPNEEFVQAIIGILPDKENMASQETKDSPDSTMGEEVNQESDLADERKAIVVIDALDSTEREEVEEQAKVSQDSEDMVGVSGISFKSKDTSVEIVNPDFASGYGDMDDGIIDDKGIQKVFPVNLERRTSKQYSDFGDGKSHLKGKDLYETQSYRVLTERMEDDDFEEVRTESVRKSVVMLPDADQDVEDPDRFVKDAKYTRRRMPSMSDNEFYNAVDSSGSMRRRRLKKKLRDKNRSAATRSKSQNSDRDYESSFMVDSGFEPSPRFVHNNRPMSPRLVAYYEDRNNEKSKIPKRKPGDRNAVDMTSVTQIVQTNMRRYFLERKIFQHLMDLKRIQIRSSKANEAMLVKRAIDEYHRSSLVHVGAGRYTSNDFTFKSFEKFLYDSLRKLQRSGGQHLMNLPEKAFPDFDVKNIDNYKMDGLPDNPILCTSKTHRCFHAVHAYTGIPCSAYIPVKLNHHTMPKPGTARKTAGFLPQIKNKIGKRHNSQITLELCHGNEKQMIALPAEKLDKNKRYYVTFTVKGSNQNSDSENKQNENAQRNVKSV